MDFSIPSAELPAVTIPAAVNAPEFALPPAPGPQIPIPIPAPNPNLNNHLPYSELIVAAIQTLNEATGSSRIAISRYIEKQFSGNVPANHSALLTQHLKLLKDAGHIVLVKHSYMLAGSAPPPPVVPAIGFAAAAAANANPTSSPSSDGPRSTTKRRGRPPKPKPKPITNPQIQPNGVVGLDPGTRPEFVAPSSADGSVVKRRPGRRPKLKTGPVSGEPADVRLQPGGGGALVVDLQLQPQASSFQPNVTLPAEVQIQPGFALGPQLNAVGTQPVALGPQPVVVPLAGVDGQVQTATVEKKRRGRPPKAKTGPVVMSQSGGPVVAESGGPLVAKAGGPVVAEAGGPVLGKRARGRPKSISVLMGYEDGPKPKKVQGQPHRKETTSGAGAKNVGRLRGRPKGTKSTGRQRGRPRKTFPAVNAAAVGGGVTVVPFDAAAGGVLPAKRPARPPKMGGVKKPRKLTGRPLGRPKKNASGTAIQAEQQAYQDLKNKLAHIQSRINAAVSVVKPLVNLNSETVNAVQALQELEKLAAMDVDVPSNNPVEVQEPPAPQIQN